MTPNRAPGSPACVGVWGHYYGANLGDELVTHVVVEAVRRRRPDARIRAFSLDPADTRARHGVPAAPITARPHRSSGGRRPSGWRRIARGLARRGGGPLREGPHLWRSYRALRQVDLLLVAGSGQLLDAWSGPWAHPYTLFKWTTLARLAGTRVAFLSVGAGPIDRRLSRWFIRRAVQQASDVSVRDQGSARTLRAAGVTKALPVVPDMAFGLPVEEVPQSVSPPGAGERLRVGVNAMAHASAHYWGRGDERRYRAYVWKLAQSVRGIVEEGADVTLFSSQTAADPRTAQDVLDALEAGGSVPPGRVAVHPVRDTRDLLSVVAGCHAVIGARYHCVLSPLLMGIPTIGLAYHPKTVHLMAMAGQGDYCLDIDAFEADQLLDRFRMLTRHAAAIRLDLERAVPALRAAVDEQFDLVLSTERTAHVQKEPMLR